MPPVHLSRAVAVLGFLVALHGLAHADVDACPVGYLLTSQGCVKLPPPGPGDEYVAAMRIIAKEPKKAFKLLEHACTMQHAPSCSELGQMYKSGRGRVVQKDPKKADTLFDKACTMGDAHSCQILGNEAMNGGDYKVARDRLAKACNANDKLADGIACAQLGFLFQQGMGGDADEAGGKAKFDKAHKILDAHCTKSLKTRDGQACFVRGYLAEKAIGEPEDKAKALAGYRLACEAKDSDGCGFLAVTLDATAPTEALAYYKKACDLDRADACSTAAGRMSDADPKSTVPLDLAKKACDLDSKQCSMLARLNELGRGMANADQNTATAFYKNSCDAGDQGTCATYGKRVHDGIGTKPDAALADKILDAACTAEEASACRQLAIYLSGAKTDDARAFRLAQQGCKLGANHACYVQAWMIRYNRRGTPALDDTASSKESLPYFETACEKDSAFACDEAGMIYAAGLGTKKDTTLAAARYKKACADEDDTQAHACAAFADLSVAGDGTPKDMMVALHSAVRACTHDHAGACEWLPNHVGEPALLKAAVDELEPRCAKGADDLCYTEALVLGRGTPADKHRSAEILAASCQRKHMKACLAQAQIMYNGFGVPEDKAKAEQLYKQYCDDGEGLACIQLAVISLNDKKDAPASLRYGDQACKLDIADGCTQAGYIYYTAQKGVTWDMKKASDYMVKACNLKSSYGCSNQAIFYRFGITTPVDAKKAFELYSLACDLGSPPGCGGMGHYLATGEGGIKIDHKKATEALTGACDSEDAISCSDLANLLEHDHQSTASDIERMRIRAFTLLQKQSENNPGDLYYLGTFYRDGIATMKDPKKALEAFEKSCEGWDPLGCITSAKLLAVSDVPADQERARQYFKNACAGGVDEGCKLKDGGAGPAGPGKVHAKGCGCSGTAPGARGGLALLVVVVVLLLHRRRR